MYKAGTGAENTGEVMDLGVRTDLAMEAESLWRQSAGKTTALHGVKARSWKEQDLELTQVEILEEQGAEALGKPKGTYLTLEAPELDRRGPEAAEVLGRYLTEFLKIRPEDRVLVVGLGNREITPDRIGPDTAGEIFVTAHLKEQMPELFGGIRPVYALTPGVLGTTGMESAHLVAAAAERLRPDRILAVDALAAGDRDRLCRAIQLTDAGIVPGSGVGNSRAEMSQRVLGVPVCALGVPTVMDAGAPGEEPLMVTPRDIDARVRRFSHLLAAGIHQALFPDWTGDEIAQLRN